MLAYAIEDKLDEERLLGMSKLTRKNKKWLFVTVAALSLGVGVNTYSTNVQAADSTQTQQSSSDSSGTVENGDVKYTIKDGTLMVH